MAEERFDTVVIGSGFGGAVAACRLAEEGREVLVLERGQPYPPGSFPRTPRELRTSFWDPAEGLFGLFDIWSFSDLKVVTASGLGGGSLIYANVMLRKDERTFVREDLLDGGYEDWPLTRADLDPHYDRVEARQRPRPYPIAEAPYDTTAKTHALLDAAEALDLPAQLPPIAVRFAPDEHTGPAPRRPIAEQQANLHHAARYTCHLAAECDLGCNVGAKDSLDFTYLSDAQRAGAVLRTCCEARVLERRADGDWSVGYVQHLAARDGHRDELLDPAGERQRTVRAGSVVLGAGAVGSPRLLLSNRATLPGLSPQLGRQVSANGDAIAWVRDATRLTPDGVRVPRYLDPSRGPVITASIDVPAHRSPSGREFHVQDAGAPAFTEWVWQGLEVPGDVWRARRRLAGRLADRLRGRRQTRVGALLAALMGDAHGSAAMMPVLAMGRDVPDGRYRLAGDRLELDWTAEPSEAHYAAVHDGFRRVARALGGRAVEAPFNESITVHPVGGCPMGVDRRRGVVDPWGQVFGHPGLYIADGAAFPGPVGPNPGFTIAAFADRVADGMLGDRPVGAP